ncbi:hypothetical protein GE107_23355 [Cohnella sp. CFH 77786]|uniref:S1 family peptidase n=1 Tax=Cohnella sp. CFH 77786 TaxID=2662265 RepID=UPI001C610162|nr:S1 family peptidase [Cohnella sp. CFH 77786]MBW5448980.1 hypothetical protein [Cohnella sp. CFH 77786]
MSIATDVVDNEIEVGLRYVTENATNYMTNRYGKMLEFFQVDESMLRNESKTSMYNPIQSGVIIGSSSGSTCSVGFSAKNSSNSYFVVTAGHCHDGVAMDTFKQPYWGHADAYIVGSSNITGQVRDAGSVDAMLIPTPSWIVSNDVYLNSSRDEAITSYQRESNEYVGQYVAFSGYNNTSYGLIGSTNISSLGNSNLTAANYTAIPGDSGGILFDDYDGILMGTHVGDGTLNGNHVEVYTQVENTLNWFNITPVLN